MPSRKKATVTANSKASTSSASLLDLPTEIRMQILSHLFSDSSIVVIANNEAILLGGRDFFLTCRQINDDCSELLYASKTFVYQHSELNALVQYIRRIGPNNARRIKKLRLSQACLRYIQARRVVSRNVTYLCQLLPGLEKLELDGIGPEDHPNSTWSPGQLKTVEAFTKKAGSLFNGRVYIRRKGTAPYPITAIYRTTTDLQIPSNEIEVDITNAAQRRKTISAIEQGRYDTNTKKSADNGRILMTQWKTQDSRYRNH